MRPMLTIAFFMAALLPSHCFALEEARGLALRVESQSGQWIGTAIPLGFWGPVITAKHVVSPHLRSCDDPIEETKVVQIVSGENRVTAHCYDEVPLDIASVASDDGEVRPYEVVRLRISEAELQSLEVISPQSIAYDRNDYERGDTAAYGWPRPFGLPTHDTPMTVPRRVKVNGACGVLPTEPIIYCASNEFLYEGMSGGPVVLPEMMLAGVTVHRRGWNTPENPLAKYYEGKTGPELDDLARDNVGISMNLIISLQLSPRVLLSLMDKAPADSASYYRALRLRSGSLKRTNCQGGTRTWGSRPMLAPPSIYILASHAHFLKDEAAAHEFIECSQYWSQLESSRFYKQSMDVVVTSLCLHHDSISHLKACDLSASMNRVVRAATTLGSSSTYLPGYLEAKTAIWLGENNVRASMASTSWKEAVAGKNEQSRKFVESTLVLASYENSVTGDHAVDEVFRSRLPPKLGRVDNPYLAISNKWSNRTGRSEIALTAQAMNEVVEKYSAAPRTNFLSPMLSSWLRVGNYSIDPDMSCSDYAKLADVPEAGCPSFQKQLAATLCEATGDCTVPTLAMPTNLRSLVRADAVTTANVTFQEDWEGEAALIKLLGRPLELKIW